MRSRNIKPGFYKNEQLAECSFEARLLFPGLWMIADRAGRMEYRPKRIKAELFPFDNIDVVRLVGELEREKLVVRYQSGNLQLLWIPGFTKHQAPHVKEKQSELPECPLESTMLEPDEHQESTVLEPDEHPLIPDSLLLIPDSLIPEEKNIGEKPPKKKNGFDLSFIEDEHKEPMSNFMEMRKALKKPLTQRALELNYSDFKKAASHFGASFSDVVDFILKKSWQSPNIQYMENAGFGGTGKNPSHLKAKESAISGFANKDYGKSGLI